MAQLIFFTGPMNSGKSTLALQTDFTETQAGRAGRVFTRNDRAGAATLSSRIGLEQPAIEVTDDLNFWAYATRELTQGRRLDYLICDETQFFTPAQIDELARVVDELGIDVFAFGILSDFRTEMFPGSKRLVELADRVERLQVQPVSWCGAQATHNARVVDGVMVVEGSQVVVGDVDARIDEPEQTVRYEVLCRKHHRDRMTKLRSQTVVAETLPLNEES